MQLKRSVALPILILLCILSVVYLNRSQPTTETPNSPEQNVNSSESPEDSGCNKEIEYYVVLKNSQILQKNQIKILIAQANQQRIAFPYLCEEINSPKYLIQEDKLMPLNGSLIEKSNQLNWGCGGPLLSAGLTPETESPNTQRLNTEGDVLLTFGNNADKIIKWIPFISDHPTENCYTNLDTHTLKNTHRYNSKHLNYEIYANFWEFNGEKANCPSNMFVTTLDKRELTSKTCNRIYLSERDCDGMTKKSTLNIETVYGLLLLKDGPSEERWLILNTPGYEGAGISAIKINNDGTLDTKSQTSIVYSGC